VRKCRQSVYSKKSHHLAQSGPGRTIWIKLTFVKFLDWSCGGDSLQAVFVIAAVNYPNELDKEGIELELIIAAVSTNQ